MTVEDTNLVRGLCEVWVLHGFNQCFYVVVYQSTHVQDLTAQNEL